MFNKKVKKLHEKNKPSDITDIQKERIKLFYNDIKSKIDNFNFVDKKCSSIIAYIIYDYEKYNINSEQSILYFYKNSDFSKEQDIKISLLRANLDTCRQKYITNNCIEDIKVKICIFFDYSDDEIESKYFNKENNQSNNSNNNSSSNNNNNDNENKTLNVTSITPKYKLEQIILNEDTKEELDKILVMLNNIDKIYHQWGFSKIDATPRSIVNFYGEPGTGKTMSAPVVIVDEKIAELVVTAIDATVSSAV